MKRVLLFLLAVLLISCQDEEQDTYLFAIENQTGAQITEVVIYAYEKNINSRCDERNLSIKQINISDTTQIIETNYPCISLYYSVNNLDYCFKFPQEDNHFELQLNKVNIITVEKR